MSELLKQQGSYTLEAYQALEAESLDTKYTFYHGEIYAMAGTTDTHNRIVLNAAMHLIGNTDDSKCDVFTESVKLELAKGKHYVYPDVMMTCNALDKADRLIKRAPSLVIEVLSQSTEAYDRGAKFHDYIDLSSLRYYILVSQYEVKVEVFSMNGNVEYTKFTNLTDLIDLPALDMQIPVSAFYKGIVFDAA